jgi:hypothetical protein
VIQRTRGITTLDKTLNSLLELRQDIRYLRPLTSSAAALEINSLSLFLSMYHVFGFKCWDYEFLLFLLSLSCETSGRALYARGMALPVEVKFCKALSTSLHAYENENLFRLRCAFRSDT